MVDMKELGSLNPYPDTVAGRLKWARELKGKHWTQAHLATVAEVSTSTIGMIESGQRISKGSLPQIADALGIRHRWLLHGELPMMMNEVDLLVARIEPTRLRQSRLLGQDEEVDTHLPSFSRKQKDSDDYEMPAFKRREIELDDNPEFPAVRRVALKASAGATGYSIDYLNDDGPPIVFRKDWYTTHNYQPSKMLALRVAGESMVPTLYPDDLIVVNTDRTEPQDGVAFVVAYEGQITVKRLMRDDGQWWLCSDNSDQRHYPRKRCSEQTEIIGEVVYRQTERI